MYAEMYRDAARCFECAREDVLFDRDSGRPEGRRGAVPPPLAPEADSPAAAAWERRGREEDIHDYGAVGVNGERQVAQGTLKWFNPSRGYGFVALEDCDEDALLNTFCLRQAGRENIARGARVTCRVARRPKGMQVIRLLSIDENGDFPFACPEQLQQGGAFERAVVKWFDCRRGYGFVSTGEGMLDIFVHTETLQRCNVDSLQSGDEIMVRLWRGPRGLSASEIRRAAPQGGNGADGSTG